MNYFSIKDNPTDEEVSVIRKGLEEFNREQTRGEIDNPGLEINLALKDTRGKVLGGLNASTMIRVMHLEVLWVAEEHRNHGFGSELVLEAERIGKEMGCITSQTWSFSFQAPDFYQKIGYEIIGIYDGYPDGITEYVVKKRLLPLNQKYTDSLGIPQDRNSIRHSIDDNPTIEEMNIVHEGLGSYVNGHIDKPRYKPNIKIRLTINDQDNKTIGGLLAGTVIRNLVVGKVWLSEPFRGSGYGRKLMLEAERIAKENHCIAAQTYCLSFQSPRFFQKLGYEVFGISDGYPNPIEEYYFIKKFK